MCDSCPHVKVDRHSIRPATLTGMPISEAAVTLLTVAIVSVFAPAPVHPDLRSAPAEHP